MYMKSMCGQQIPDQWFLRAWCSCTNKSCKPCCQITYPRSRQFAYVKHIHILQRTAESCPRDKQASPGSDSSFIPVVDLCDFDFLHDNFKIWHRSILSQFDIIAAAGLDLNPWIQCLSHGQLGQEGD
jgi:hypothetical protein